MTNLPGKTWRTWLALSSLCLAGLAPGKGFAGDALAPAPPSTPDQAHCNELGDGFFAVAGSSACVKISGYVSAGTDFSAVAAKGAQSSAPFAAKSSVGMDSQSGMSVETQFDTPLGPGRLYVQVGHNSQ